jgi:hypothetical protein
VTPQLIALYSSGPSSGKSEVASLLVKEHGFVTVKLAKTLKSMVMVMLHDFGCPMGDMWRYTEGDLKELPIPGLGVSPRYLFQTLGTEWGRTLVHPKLWTMIAVNRCRAELDKGYSVVVDDMRFPNEYEALKEAGGMTVRVVRPGVVNPGGHVSEGLLDDTLFDLEVVNSGTLDDLAVSVATLLETCRL